MYGPAFAMLTMSREGRKQQTSNKQSTDVLITSHFCKRIDCLHYFSSIKSVKVSYFKAPKFLFILKSNELNRAKLIPVGNIPAYFENTKSKCKDKSTFFFILIKFDSVRIPLKNYNIINDVLLGLCKTVLTICF